MVRKAKRQNPEKIQVARGESLPAPVGGLDAISSQNAMPEDRAITLTNLFPQPGYSEIRGGAKLHRFTEGNPVESIMPYQGLGTNNTLFAAAGNSIFEVTNASTVTASVAVTGLANARWQYVNFAG